MINLFKDMSQDEFRHFLDANLLQDYTLLDVREPVEYKELHLPGALLVPLTELVAHMEAIEFSKPVITYCRTGGRSRAAAAILAGNGHGRVLNLVGGILAFQGETARGPVHLGMQWIEADASAAQALYMGYSMETNLNRFYEKLAEGAEGELQEIFQRLAAFETRHLRLLEQTARKIIPGFSVWEDFPQKYAGLLEGALSEGDIVAENLLLGESPREAVETAMSLEVQAQDLYMRYAQRAEDDVVRQVYVDLAQEEQRHLKVLAGWIKV